MAQKGAEVHIACATDQTASRPEGGITVHPVVQDWGKKGARDIEKALKSVRPDWAVVQYAPHNFHPKGLPFGVFAFYRAFLRQAVPVLTVFHEVRIRPWGGPKNAVVSFLQMRIANRLARASARVVTSIDIYAGYLRNWRHKTALVPVGSNIPPVAVAPARAQKIRERLGIAAGDPVVCTFGNRGISPYLAAFDSLAEDFPNLIWLICGRNPTPPDILSSRPYIRYVGEMGVSDVYEHLSLGDVFFTPDLVGQPRGDGGTCNKSGSLACGCSLGIPVVGAKGDMNNALLEHGKNILLVNILEKEALRGAIESCFSSKEKAAQLGRNARKLYDEALDWPVLAEKLLAHMSDEKRNN